MSRYFFSVIIMVAISCGISRREKKKCRGKILDLELNSPDDGSKLINYFNSDRLQIVSDTAQFVKFFNRNLIPHFNMKSSKDSAKRKLTYKVQEAVIKTDSYQWDLIAFSDNDQDTNVGYWLKSYDKNRKSVGHLDFASWSKDFKFSGRVDCDSTLHMITVNGHRIFKTDKAGKNFLVENIRN